MRPLFKVFYWFACLLALFSSYEYETVGKLFLGDILVALMFSAFFLHSLVTGKFRSTPMVLWISLLFPLVGVSFDTINSVPFEDWLRGLARNGIFSACIYLSYYLCVYFSVRKAFLLFSFISISTILVRWYGFDMILMYATNFMKYAGGSGIFNILLLAFFWKRKVLAALYLLFCSVLSWLLDFRGLAAIYVASSLLVCLNCIMQNMIVFRKTWARWRNVIVLSLVLCGVGFGYLFFNLSGTYFLNDESIFQRREISNMTRMDMLQDAFDGFLRAPVFGNGSWQHPKLFISLYEGKNEDFEIGVHSFILQLAFEYGVFGLLFSLWLMYFPANALAAMVLGGKSSNDRDVPASIFICVTVLFSFMAAPFASQARLTIGLLMGMCIFLFYRSTGALSFKKERSAIMPKYSVAREAI